MKHAGMFNVIMYTSQTEYYAFCWLSVMN